VNLKQQFWGTYDEMQSYLAMEKAKERFFSLLQKKGVAAIVTKDYGGRDGTVYADVVDSYKKDGHPIVPKNNSLDRRFPASAALTGIEYPGKT
jgi:hypothetical protein